MEEELVKQLYGDNWPKRRRVLYAVLVWAISCSTYIIGFGADTKLMDTAFTMLIGLIFSITGAYVFGAVWDDANKRKSLSESSPVSTSDTSVESELET